jgi:riboflavin kinase / FMN adenylyltransferase
MRVIQSLSPSIAIQEPLAITIGNFDGVHLGHQAILSKLTQKVAAEKGQTLVISFENHPVEILRQGITVPKLCSLKHKQILLQDQSIDYLILLPFTKEFSQQTPEEFLKKLKALYPFDYLVLGHDAVLGKNREGNSRQIKQLSKELNFVVEYLEEQSLDGTPISSSKIRSFIMEGNLDLAEKFLGRRYSIYSPIVQIQENGILTIDVEGLCLPPLGKYEIKLKYAGEFFDGIANLTQMAIKNLELKCDIKTQIAGECYLEVIF